MTMTKLLLLLKVPFQIKDVYGVRFYLPLWHVDLLYQRDCTANSNETKINTNAKAYFSRLPHVGFN